MQITKTKSGRLAYSVFNSIDEGLKNNVYFAIVECKETIADETRLFYLLSFGYASKHYDVTGNAVYKLDFSCNVARRDYLLDGYKFSEKAFSKYIQENGNDINSFLFLFNKKYENKIQILSEIDGAKLF